MFLPDNLKGIMYRAHRDTAPLGHPTPDLRKRQADRSLVDTCNGNGRILPPRTAELLLNDVKPSTSIADSLE